MLDKTQNIQMILGQVPVNKLKVPNYHGNRNPFENSKVASRCKKFLEDAKGFDEKLCEPLTVCLRDDGFYWIIDGVGRYWMGLESGQKELPARILHNLSLASEVWVFRMLLQQRRRGTPVDLFLGTLSTNRENAKLAQTVQNFGFRIGDMPRSMPLISPQVIKFINTLGVLDLTLATIKNSTWYNRKIKVVHYVAVACVIAKCRPKDIDRLRAIMGAMDVERSFNRAMKDTHDVMVHPHVRNISWYLARALVHDYNRKLLEPRRMNIAKLHFTSPDYNIYSPPPC